MGFSLRVTMKFRILAAIMIETKPNSPVLSRVTHVPRVGTGAAVSRGRFDAYERRIRCPISESSRVRQMPGQQTRR
jgi:hypothetical protein